MPCAQCPCLLRVRHSLSPSPGVAWSVHLISNSIECKPNLSDTLQSLVGQQNARHGIIKIFNALQETRANKHLLYVSNLKPTRGLVVNSVLCLCSHMGVDFNPLHT